MATTDKYDRQIRLWGSNGQRALCSSHIVLVNATTAGTETLKNLVLPGIGSFHIVDDQTIPSISGSGDRFSNFFAPINKETSGKSRSEVACQLVSELNEDVRGTYQHIQSLAELDVGPLLEKSAEHVLVIAADVPLRPLLSISKACQARNIPLVIVKSYGLIGTVRVQTPHHPIIESKPDNALPDLRLANFDPPFESLQTLSENTDLDQLSKTDHAHVPYVIILLKAMDQWRLRNTTKRFPETLDEKNQFKEIVKGMSRNFKDELNFQEAFREAYLAYARRDLPCEVQTLLEQSEPPYNTSFDLLVAALKTFLERNHNEPPLNGSIPDMASGTEPYIALQKAYHQKASSDLAQMRNILQQIQNGTATPKVSEEELTTFAKNVYNLQHLSTRSFETEMASNTSESALDDDIRDDIFMSCMDPSDPPEQTPLLWALALRACETFQFEHGTYPGNDPRQLAIDSDVSTVHSKLVRIIEAMGLQDCDLIRQHLIQSQNHVREMVRYYNADVHNVASVVGGVASQEAVKLITGQYVPLNNCYIFNGICGIGGVYQF